MKKTLIIVAIILVIAVCIYLLQGNKNSSGIQAGDTVTISYQSTLPDGRIFNNSGQETIIIGENTIPGLDNNLIGHQSGSILNIIIPAAQGYGIYYDPNKLQRMPIYTLTQAGITAQPETFVLLGGTRYYIQTLENDVATLDANPEHTRQDLTYTIQIISRNKQ